MLRIPSVVHRAMLDHAVAELPNECCGLLAGLAGRVSHHYPLVNALASPTEFESEPRSMLAAHKAMRAAGIEVLAVYHSHPTGFAIPSHLDRIRNYSDRVLNLIIGMRQDPAEIRAYWLTLDSARDADFVVDDDPGTGSII